MKKMMVALAGILSVLMLASCEKVVEIDGDVSIKKTNYSYRMEVAGTASYVIKDADDAQPVELVVNKGWLRWDDYANTNQKEYHIDTWYNGDSEKGCLYLSNLDLGDLIEYKGEFYLGDVNSKNKVAVTGSPRDNSFSVKMSNREVWLEGTGYVLLTFDLKFSR